ncbi:sialate O-acetylesterase [Glaciecola sp. 1036]|uniref:sialate O-acetylesterase n=1 Tax=Alteromonadaceae TaxID=72275 RepID=UPI003D0470AE
MQKISLLVCLFILFFSQQSLALSLHKLISDGAVMQRGVEIPLSGNSEHAITVFLDGNKIANATPVEGKWSVILPPQKAGGPHVLEIHTNQGEQIKVEDIFFGDVFLTSGQSNMELTIARTEEAFPKDVALANYPLIREFTVPDRYNFNHPQDDLESGHWRSATPDNIRQLSAVAYYTARQIHLQEGVPIGIVNASLGGSPIEAWLSKEALSKYPEWLEKVEPYKDAKYIEQIEQKNSENNNYWYGELNKRDAGLNANPQWSTEALDHSDWQVMEVPGFPELESKDGNFIGSWWLRKTIQVSESMAEQDSILRLGRIINADETYVNGKKVGNTTYQYPPRRYKVPAGTLHAGENTIAIRVINGGGKTQILKDKPYYIGNDEWRISLKGPWHYKQASTMPPGESTVFVRWQPLGLYNAMIAPISQYPVKGAFWFQGESNVGRYKDYGDKLTTMIADWRKAYSNAELPFVVIQLANFLDRDDKPQESAWAGIRAQQAMVSEQENVGLAVTIDLGEYNDIHPVNKRTVGERAALAMRKLVYNPNLPASGPVVKEVTQQNNALLVSFSDPANHLALSESGHNGFELADEDGKFHWAKVELTDQGIKLSHPDIVKPTAVRYAWANNPVAGLYNLYNLPAVPFEKSVN